MDPNNDELASFAFSRDPRRDNPKQFDVSRQKPRLDDLKSL
jgi:hypothetical protein